MRRILYLGAVLLVGAGCGSASHSRHVVAVSGACGSDLVWHDRLYYAEPVAGLPAFGESLGSAGVPSCPDVLGGETGASRAVEVSRLAGVDPGLALAVVDDPQHGYFAAGTFVQLPSHPLHFVLDGAGMACLRPRRVRLAGTVERNDGRLELRGARGRAVVLVDERTRVDGLSRDGLPYIAIGRRVAVEAVRCGGSRLVARRVAALEPAPRPP